MDTSVLFSLQATGAIRLKKMRDDENGDISYMMKMKKVNDNVTWFTDRPKRDAGSGTLRELIQEWDENFRSSNPNSALSYIDKDGNPDTIVFEQYKPKFNKRKGVLTSKIKIHGDQVLKDISSKRKNPLSELALDSRLGDNDKFDYKFKNGSLFIDNIFTKDTQVEIYNRTNQTLLFTQLAQNVGDVDLGLTLAEAAVELGAIVACGAELLANPKPRKIEPGKRAFNNQNLRPLRRGGDEEMFESLMERVEKFARDDVPISDVESVVEGGIDIELGSQNSQALASMVESEVGDVGIRAIPVVEEAGGIEVAGGAAVDSVAKGATGKILAAVCLIGKGYLFLKSIGHALRGTYTNGFYPIKNFVPTNDSPLATDYFVSIPPDGKYTIRRAEGGAFTREGSKDVNFAVNILSPTDDKLIIPYGVFSFDNPAIGHPKAYYKQLSGFDYSEIQEDKIIESGKKGDEKTVRNRNPVLDDVKSKVVFLDGINSASRDGSKVMGWDVTFNGNVADDVIDTLAGAKSQIVPD